MNPQKYKARSVACANIALIKYWGKRDPALNLPAVGSISITLDALQTDTRISFQDDFTQDSLTINDQIAPENQRLRVEKFLDLIRRESGVEFYANIISTNNFPTGAGLASSASAFAALSLAATRAVGLNLTSTKLSALARRGSGSAPRSIFGGFVEMKRSKDKSGRKDIAVQLASADHWDLRVLILITSTGQKKIGSTQAMNASMETSPYFQRWVDSSDKDLRDMRSAIREKDFEKLGDLAEHNALKMHALTLSSRPPIIYWNQTTIELMHFIQGLREKGLPAYFTIDAGPQVKVITMPEYIPKLKTLVKDVPGIKDIIETKLGEGTRLIREAE